MHKNVRRIPLCKGASNVKRCSGNISCAAWKNLLFRIFISPVVGVNWILNKLVWKFGRGNGLSLTPSSLASVGSPLGPLSGCAQNTNWPSSVSSIKSNPEKMPDIFYKMFYGNTERTIKFLSNKSSFLDDISVILKMPKWIFIKSIFS